MNRHIPNTWNDSREFTRGQIFFVNFQNEAPMTGRPSRLIRGPHRAVVLFESTYPRNTVVVVPISSLYDQNGDRKETISSDVTISSSDYHASCISEDSFIMTNQITSVTRSRLERCVGQTQPKDMVKLDVQLISTLSLSQTVQGMIELEVGKRLSQMGISTEEEA